MTDQQQSGTRAVARVDEIPLPTAQVITVARKGEVERVEQAVKLPAIYQYPISRYGQGTKVMITSDGYDFINRSMGVQLYQPAFVHDEQGKKVRNPIHRSDYIYIRLVGIWWNDLGQMTSYREDLEVDFKLVYHDARINSKSARVELDASGQPVFGDGGMPIVRLDGSDELKALKALSQLRTFGLRYAQTVAKTRILKTASGIKQLPIAVPREFSIRVVGFRDNLTPQERMQQAQRDMASMFGPGTALDESSGLTADEIEALQEIEANDTTDELDRDLVAAAHSAQGGDDEAGLLDEVYEGVATHVEEESLGLAEEPVARRR